MEVLKQLQEILEKSKLGGMSAAGVQNLLDIIDKELNPPPPKDEEEA